jgi:hypothetical protein
MRAWVLATASSRERVLFQMPSWLPARSDPVLTLLQDAAAVGGGGGACSSSSSSVRIGSASVEHFAGVMPVSLEAAGAWVADIRAMLARHSVSAAAETPPASSFSSAFSPSSRPRGRRHLSPEAGDALAPRDSRSLHAAAAAAAAAAATGHSFPAPALPVLKGNHRIAGCCAAFAFALLRAVVMLCVSAVFALTDAFCLSWLVSLLRAGVARTCCFIRDRHATNSSQGIDSVPLASGEDFGCLSRLLANAILRSPAAITASVLAGHRSAAAGSQLLTQALVASLSGGNSGGGVRDIHGVARDSLAVVLAAQGACLSALALYVASPRYRAGQVRWQGSLSGARTPSYPSKLSSSAKIRTLHVFNLARSLSRAAGRLVVSTGVCLGAAGGRYWGGGSAYNVGR